MPVFQKSDRQFGISLFTRTKPIQSIYALAERCLHSARCKGTVWRSIRERERERMVWAVWADETGDVTQISTKLTAYQRPWTDNDIRHMKSIISNKRACLICGNTETLHKHHIFFGTANRQKSDEDGCWCYLCVWHHNGSNSAVHYNRQLDLNLKRHAQRQWELIYGTREEFIKRYGTSYLWHSAKR